MKTKLNLVVTPLMVLSSIWFMSCEKDDIEIIHPAYKTLNVSCGDDFNITVRTDHWGIESVKDIISGENLLDKNGNSLTLDGNGKVEAANGWLTFIRDSEDKFTIRLKENFDKSKDRKFVICLKKKDHREYITVTQQAGTEYELVKSTFKEIVEERKIYQSDKECTDVTLTNPTAEAAWMPYGYIFKNVVASSTFESDDYGGFSWIPEEGIEVNPPELIIDAHGRWANNCTYKEGTTTTPYIKDIPNGSKVLMPPYSTWYFKGEVTYCKRICSYTFTIQNIESETQFEINGTWTHIVPISSSTINFDKYSASSSTTGSL